MGQNTKRNEINCLYANLQSLISKKREIELKLDQENFHLLFFNEIWISEDFDYNEFSLKSFQKPIVDPNFRGGSCIFVREGIDFRVIKPPRPVKESVWIMIKTSDNVKRMYACIYRSPNSPNQNNEDLLYNLEWSRMNFSECVLTGA